MSEASQLPSGFGYSAMTFGNKVNAAIELTKRHGLTIFLTLLVGWVVLFVVFFVGLMIFGGIPMMMAGQQASAGITIGAILGMILVYIIFILLAQFFMIGTYSLLLKYVDGQRPADGVISQVLSPWRNFVPVLLCVIVWMAIYFVCSIVLGIFSLIPFLGILINLAGSLILAIVLAAANMYIADKGNVTIGDVILTPINLVKDNFLTWLGAMGAAIIAYLPGIILVVIIMVIGSGSMAVMLLSGLFGMVYFVAVSIFTFLFFAITYRQTHGGGMESVVEQVF